MRFVSYAVGRRICRSTSGVSLAVRASAIAFITQSITPNYSAELQAARRRVLSIALGSSSRDTALDQSSRRGQAFRSLFEGIATTELDRLTGDSDQSIALQARWELARKPRRRRPHSNNQSEWIYDPQAILGFLICFRNSAGYDPPLWWVNGVRRVDLVPGQGAFVQLELVELAVNSSSSLRGVETTIPGSKVTLSDGSHRIAVSQARQVASYSFLFDEHRAYVDEFDGACSNPSTLTCYDLQTGRIVWTQEVWGSFRGGGGGSTTHIVSMALHGQDIAVFGCDDGAYAESFSTNDGAPVYKFCTTYWGNYPETWHVPWNRLPDIQEGNEIRPFEPGFPG